MNEVWQGCIGATLVFSQLVLFGVCSRGQRPDLTFPGRFGDLTIRSLSFTGEMVLLAP